MVHRYSVDHGGFTVEELANINNLFGPGKASPERLRQMEERALRKVGISLVERGLVGPFPRSDQYKAIVDYLKSKEKV